MSIRPTPDHTASTSAAQRAQSHRTWALSANRIQGGYLVQLVKPVDQAPQPSRAPPIESEAKPRLVRVLPVFAVEGTFILLDPPTRNKIGEAFVGFRDLLRRQA